jgi:GNAT superfamily N-acetyltransferase
MRQPHHSDPDEVNDYVGRRVVARYRLHNQEFGATDVLGVMESWSDGVLRVRRDAADIGEAEIVSISESDVIALKAVPRRGTSRRSVRNLESAAARGWQALETQQLGGWLLRAADGFSGRANSCLPLHDPGLPVSDAVDVIERWYRERGLIPAFQIPEPLGASVGVLLDARGWAGPAYRTLMLTADLNDVAGATRALPVVRIDDRPDAQWLASYHYQGGKLPDGASRVLMNVDIRAFASIDDGGNRVAIARGAVSEAPDGRRWLGLTALEVVPSVRRRGYARHIMAGLASWAAKHEATSVYVQVAEPNVAAQTMYRRVGFVDHHYYHFRRLHPPSDEG